MKESERIIITSDGFIWFRLRDWEARMCQVVGLFCLYELDDDESDRSIDTTEELERAIACGQRIVVEGDFLPSPLLETFTKDNE